jgi:transcription initiation factor TFIIH subunit 4
MMKTNHSNATLWSQHLVKSPQWLEQVETLYTSPYVTSCIFETLSSVQKVLVVRLLFVQEVEAAVVLKWFQKQSNTAVNHLVALKILNRRHESNSVYFQLNPKFQASLQDLILCKVPSPFRRKPESSIDVTFLSQYSRQCWNQILQFLVGLESPGHEPSMRIVQVLVSSGLIEQVKDGFRITRKGFQFLLKDIQEQVWFILENILFSTSSKEEEEEVKSFSRGQLAEFLFELSFCASGVAYCRKTKTGQQEYLHYLADLGLVYLSSFDDDYFYVTPLGLTRSLGCWLGEKSSSESNSSDIDDDCQIIVETNFRVYVYTNCTFQITLLSLFIQFLYRLPNMAVGMITRDSIRAALDNGITAQQMITFLQSHMHPIMKGRLPITVIDQIRLWEAQRFRVDAKNALLLDNFENRTQLEKACEFAKQLGVYLWSNDDILVTEEAAQTSMMEMLFPTLSRGSA